MNDMMNERALQQTGEMRSGSIFGKGQVVAADCRAQAIKGSLGEGGSLKVGDSQQVQT
jgi:nitric oxide reductase large subunit